MLSVGGIFSQHKYVLDSVTRSYTIDQRNSSIPKFSIENTFVRLRSESEDHIDGEFLGFRLGLPKNMLFKEKEHSIRNAIQSGFLNS
jgi:hypothetical protein